MKLIIVKSCYLACVSLFIVGLIQNAIASSWNERNVKNENSGFTTNGFISDGSSQDKISVSY